MIEVKGLRKVFQLSRKQMKVNNTEEKYKVAVDGIDFIVYDNEIFGLLGPNGAGKTTTLRCMSTLIVPSGGTISVNGHDCVKDPLEVRSQLAFLTSELKLDTHFTPDYTTRFFGKLHNMDNNKIETRMEYLFDYFGVTPFRYTKIGDLSTGMKQKLSIVVSLIHDPGVIIFDEPTNGLDIITAKAVTDYLLELKAQGKTIILSTHMMHVAEKLCDRIGIIMDGKIKAIGTLDEILYMVKEKNLEDAFFKLYHQGNRGELDA